MSAPVASSSSSSKKPIAKPSNPFANYSTAQSLGYADPDAERIAAQLELRQSQGVAGEWQIITPPQAPVTSYPLDPTPPTAADGDRGLKREAEAPPEEDIPSFKLRKKSLNPGLGEIYDPGLIPIKVKTTPFPDVKPEERGLTVDPKDVTKETAGQEPELKVDPGIKTEDDQPDTSNVSTASLFKKRKAPVGAAKGRRQI